MPLSELQDREHVRGYSVHSVAFFIHWKTPFFSDILYDYIEYMGMGGSGILRSRGERHETFYKRSYSNPDIRYTSLHDLFLIQNIIFYFTHPGRALLSVQVRQPHLDSPSVGLELLHLCEPHDGGADVAQAVGGEVRAGDVLLEGAEVDARVLLCEAVSG